jgi:maltose alpha-D-glucosyltransferase / alpha-amylase
MRYFGDDGERMQMIFNFHVNQHLFYALAAADSRPLAQALNATGPRPATAQWGLFLRDHDNSVFVHISTKSRAKPRLRQAFPAKPASYWSSCCPRINS